MKTKEQILIDKITPNLPIAAYPERELLPRLWESFENEKITLKTELEIHSMADLGEAGGLACEVRIKGMDPAKVRTAVLTSVTHIKIKKDEPHYPEIQKYRVKRIRKLMRQNRRFF